MTNVTMLSVLESDVNGDGRVKSAP
jgi:hypothetical protein